VIFNSEDMSEGSSRKLGQVYHGFPENVPTGKLAETLVGMANSKGGTVLLGVSPRSGRIQGISNPSKAMDKVFQAALLPDPPLVLPMPRLQNMEGTQVMEISVPDGLPHVYNIDGRYLLREGTQTVPISARRLRHLLVERGVVLFESQTPPDAGLEDLNQDKVDRYLKAVSPIEDENMEKFLLRRGCLRSVSGKLTPTYGGLLLFASRPQRWLPNATILAARFSGTAFTDQFVRKDISGTLVDQLEQVDQFISDNMRSVLRMTGLRHEVTTEYPFEAVRELMVNAVAHRDYNIQGDNIHLNLFADRIEVHSPGGLPGPVNLDNLLEARFSRNAVIVQILSDLGYIERLGYGLDRVVNAMQQHGLPRPRFEEAAGTFRVTLFGGAESYQAPRVDLSRYAKADLKARQKSALD